MSGILYVVNDPLNKTDPTGLRPDDSSLRVDVQVLGKIQCPPYFDTFESTPGMPSLGISAGSAQCQAGDTLQGLLDLGGYIRTAARMAGIGPHLLAATLLHEGAAILRGGILGNGARAVHQAKNSNEVVRVKSGNPSSGIGQLQAPAARHGLGYLGVDVSGMSNYSLLTALTYVDSFSVFAAGGYLGSLKDEDRKAGGSADDHALFMMYSMNPPGRLFFRSKGYDVQATEGSSLFGAGVLVARDRSWVKGDQAARAAGF